MVYLLSTLGMNFFSAYGRQNHFHPPQLYRNYPVLFTGFFGLQNGIFFAIFIWGEKKCKHVKENYPCLNNNLALEITKLYGHTEEDDDTASNYVKKRVEFHGNSSFRKESDI